MLRDWDKILRKHEVIILSIIAGIAAYVIDAAIDAFVFHDGPFLDVLIFAVPLGEVLVRSYILASFVIFGIFISRILGRCKKAEEALRDSERRYRNLIETAPEVIYTLSAKDGTITSLNPAFEKITGWSCAEWIGKSFTSIIHPDDLPLATETFQETLRGETPSPYELHVLSKSGKYLIGEFTSIPLIENGKVVGEFGIVRDITERKQVEDALKKEEKRFRDVVANTGEWIWEVDSDGKYTYASPIVEQVLGYKPEEVLGKHFYDFFLSEEREQLKEAAFEVIARRERFTGFVNRKIHKSGRIVTLETSGVPIQDADGHLL